MQNAYLVSRTIYFLPVTATECRAHVFDHHTKWVHLNTHEQTKVCAILLTDGHPQI